MWRLSSIVPKPTLLARAFSTTSSTSSKTALPPRRKIPETDLIESFLKGTGPGGQKINKTSSAVQLKHIPTGIVVKSQHTRSRDQNRRYAREILGEKLDLLEKGDQSRTAIKAERERSKKASKSKKSRRKYRKLEEQKAGEESDGLDELDDEVEGNGDAGATRDESVRSDEGDSMRHPPAERTTPVK